MNSTKKMAEHSHRKSSIVMVFTRKNEKTMGISMGCLSLLEGIDTLRGFLGFLHPMCLSPKASAAGGGYHVVKKALGALANERGLWVGGWV